MKTRKDYSKSPAPRFDALQDLIEFLGDRWPRCNDHLKRVTDVDQFAQWADFAGVEGAFIEVWYDHIYGEGAWLVAGGVPQFTDGLALHPMTIRRAFARDMLEDIQGLVDALATDNLTAITDTHPLRDLSTDDAAAVEDWVQSMIERADQDDIVEDDKTVKSFIDEVENKLIDRMVEKVLDQRQRMLEEKFTHGFVLHGLNSDELFKVVDFLNSYKVRLED